MKSYRVILHTNTVINDVFYIDVSLTSVHVQNSPVIPHSSGLIKTNNLISLHAYK